MCVQSNSPECFVVLSHILSEVSRWLWTSVCDCVAVFCLHISSCMIPVFICHILLLVSLWTSLNLLSDLCCFLSAWSILDVVSCRNWATAAAARGEAVLPQPVRGRRLRASPAESCRHTRPSEQGPGRGPNSHPAQRFLHFILDLVVSQCCGQIQTSRWRSEI